MSLVAVQEFARGFVVYGAVSSHDGVLSLDGEEFDHLFEHQRERCAENAGGEERLAKCAEIQVDFGTRSNV